MQGFNRYFGADFDWRDEEKNTLNKKAGKHALGDRARKLDQGILITRFELPFNIWCLNCQPNSHIGQGVRYNAEKKKIGNYYSTPIFSFRCKCHLCAGWFEIQTDPKNTRYVVTEGAKQQAQDFDPADGGHLVGYTGEGERDAAAAAAGGAAGGGDAFASFEKASSSKQRAFTAAERLVALEEHNDDRWADPYDLNRNLRKALREDKGKRKEKQASDAALADRYSLGEDVRLDLVRGDEERREDSETRAAWLSSAEKHETKQDKEDAILWQEMQARRTRVELDSGQRVRQTPTAAAAPAPSRRTTSRVVSGAARTAPYTSAASQLSKQLRTNTARKSDPLGAAFGASSPPLTLGGGLVRSKRT